MFGLRGRMNTRLIALAGVFALAGLLLAARVAYIQLINDGQYKAEAKDEHYGQQVVRAARGAILDRNGYPLATTVDAYDVYVNRADWTDDDSGAQGGRDYRSGGRTPAGRPRSAKSGRTRPTSTASTSHTAASTSTRGRRSRRRTRPGCGWSRRRGGSIPKATSRPICWASSAATTPD